MKYSEDNIDEVSAKLQETIHDVLSEMDPALSARYKEILRKKLEIELKAIKEELVDEFLNSTPITETPDLSNVVVEATEPVDVESGVPEWIANKPKNKGPAFKPAGDREFELTPMQEIVKEIRDAIGDPGRLDAAVRHVVQLHTESTLDNDAKEFLLGLIARVKRIPPEDKNIGEEQFNSTMKEWKKLQDRGKAVAQRVKDIRAADTAVKAEEARLSAQIADIQSKLEELSKRRMDVLNKTKIVNPKTGEMIFLDDPASLFSEGGEITFSPGTKEDPMISLEFKQAHDFEETSEVMKRNGKSIRAMERVWVCKKCGKQIFSKPSRATVDISCPGKPAEDQMYPAGFGRSKRLKVKGPWQPDYPKDKEKLSGGLDPLDALIRAGFTREQAERKVKEGEDKKSWKSLSPEDRMKTEIDGDPKVNEIFKFKNQNPKKVNVIGEDEPKPEPIPMSVLEGVSDVPKAEPEDDTAFAKGCIRRGGKGKRITKTLKELEDEFNKAVDNYKEEYGIQFNQGTNPWEWARKGKRASGTIMAKGSKEITETEVMAASIISKDISLPYGKILTDLQIACPKKNKDEAKKGKIKEVIKESAKKVDEKVAKKVEKKPTVTVRVRRALAKTLISSAVKLANRIHI